MAFYKSSKKTILYLGEEKQREYAMENSGVEPLPVCIWCQNLKYRRVINNCYFCKQKFIKIKASKTCKIRGLLAKLHGFIKNFSNLETVLQVRRAPFYICQGPKHP